MSWFGRKHWEGYRMSEAVPIIEDDKERKRRTIEIVTKDFADNFQQYESTYAYGGGDFYHRTLSGERIYIHPGHYRSMELTFRISLGPISISVHGQDAERLKTIIKDGERARLVSTESQVLAKFTTGEA